MNQRPNVFDHKRNMTDGEPGCRTLTDQLARGQAKAPESATDQNWNRALSTAVCERLVAYWLATERRHNQANVKRAAYLSLEFLPGRLLGNAMLAAGDYAAWSRACEALGLDLDSLTAAEHAPALGNGGLGRLAACLMDSLATLELPAIAYGMRYRYGMFAQRIHDGWQIEAPEDWAANGCPWEFIRPEVKYAVHFGGQVEDGPRGRCWLAAEHVNAVACDLPIPGHATDTVLTLRLWTPRPEQPFDLAAFNHGDHQRALEQAERAADIGRVLYPDDRSEAGRELRLRQEYFFVSASLQDIIQRHLDTTGSDLSRLDDSAAIHLNDTHPAIAVAELMRLLVDEHGLDRDVAWRVCSRVFSYTNHTLMPEALETWPVALLGALLPRHLEIILAINARFLAWVEEQHPGDLELLRRVSLIDEDGERRVRMAHLAILASHRVNGVSALHGQLLAERLFADFANLFPDRFTHVTNGVTPRRWLVQANPGLAELLDREIGSAWRADLSQLAELTPLARDRTFQRRFAAVKRANKARLATHVAERTGSVIDPDSLFDVHIKRIHEYKRQLLNILGTITRYARILAAPDANWVPRTVIFAGKAASSYAAAKHIIKLIHDVAATVNADPLVAGRLKVVFIPDYGVCEAERIIPAADLSEQISTAGTEASGTGNMKLALNGAITIGTEDGANIEIREHVGAEHIFIFGHTASQIEALRANDDTAARVDADAELAHALQQIATGHFSPDEPQRFTALIDTLVMHGDHYKLLADYRAYMDAQDAVDVLYRNQSDWLASAVANVAGMGMFSSDRMAAQYANGIWGIAPASDNQAARVAP